VKTEIPTTALVDRMEAVRAERPDLSNQLREIADELPTSRPQRELHQLATAVSDGLSSAELVSRFPDLCWLLSIRSSSATADAMLSILEQSACENSLRARKLRSVAYPTILFLLIIGLFLLGCAYLVPQFDQMFQEFDLRVPPVTRWLIGLSRFINAYPVVVAAGVILVDLGGALLLWMWIDNGALRRAVLGDSISPGNARPLLAKAALQIAELCDDDLPLDRSLWITAQSMTNRVMSSALGELALQATHDRSRMNRTRAAMVIPPNFLFALSPQQNGPVEPPNTVLLRELSDSYRDISIGHREWWSFVITQLSIICVGFLLLVIIVALFSPLLSLITALS
jgi:type II secretory pathway component PulF